MTQTLETHFNLYQFENPRLGKRDTDGTQGDGVGKKCQMVLIGRRIWGSWWKHAANRITAKHAAPPHRNPAAGFSLKAAKRITHHAYDM